MKRIIFLLSFFIAASLSAQNTHVVPTGAPSPSALGNNLHHYPRVFNVRDYDWKIGDGIRVVDGAISSGSANFSSATAGFISGRDVGKCMLIPGAGVAGVDLPVIINSVTNSTTVVVSVLAATSVTADTVNFATDATSAFQAALTADSSAGGGNVRVPNGVYMFNGPYYAASNSILHIPLMNLGNAKNRTRFIIEGETSPNWTAGFADRLGDSLSSHAGVVLLPITTGTTGSSLFGSDLSNFNWSYASFKNLTILTPRNKLGGGPTMGGINTYNLLSADFKNILVAPDGSLANVPTPTNEVAGIVLPKIGVDILSYGENLLVEGYRYGIILSDHFEGNNIATQANVNGFVFSGNAFAGGGNHWTSQWNAHCIYAPTQTIFGYITPGTALIKIGLLNIEDLTIPGSPGFTYVDVINDSSNYLTGNVGYYFLSGHAGDFKKYKGLGVICEQLGSYGNRYDTARTLQGLAITFPLGDPTNKTTDMIFQQALGAGSQSTISFKGSGVEQFRWYSDNAAATYGTSNTFSGRELSLYDSARAKYPFIANGNSQVYIGATSWLQYGLRAETPGSGVRTLTLNAAGQALFGDSITGARAAPVQIKTANTNADLAGLTIQNTNASSAADVSIQMFNDLGQGATKGNTIYKFSSGAGGGLANGFGIYNYDAGPINFSGSSNEMARMFQTGHTSLKSTTDSAVLQVGAGSTTFAPFKLTASALLTTPISGAHEFDGANYYVDVSTTRYTLAKTLTNTAVLDFPSTGVGAIADLTITVTGAAVGDAVVIGVDNASVTTTGTFTAWVSATNTVTIRYSPKATEDPASGTFRASVLKY